VMGMTLAQVAERVGGRVLGDPEVVITGIGSLEEAGPGDITFLSHPRYARLARTTRASAVLARERIEGTEVQVIQVSNPDWAFALIAEVFAPAPPRFAPGIHELAVVAEDVSVGEGASIQALSVVEGNARIGDRTLVYPQVYIGHRAEIGCDCRIYPRVVIRERCVIGNRVIIHSGAVIGSDGFGYVTLEGEHHKIPQVGRVVIEDDVEIGANCAIDRARSGETRVRRGTKIDNLVQIGHNCDIGEDCIIVGQCGLSGSTTLEDHVVLGGQVGLADHIRIGAGAQVAAKSGVARDMPAGAVYRGNPATDKNRFARQQVAVRRLPRIIEQLRELSKRVERLESAAHDSKRS